MYTIIKTEGYDGITSIDHTRTLAGARAFVMGEAHTVCRELNKKNRHWHHKQIARLKTLIKTKGPNYVEPLMMTGFAKKSDPTVSQRLAELLERGPSVYEIIDREDVISVSDVVWEIDPIYFYEEE